MNIEELRKKHEEMLNGKQSGGNNDDFLAKFLKLEMGKNIVRILPWRDSDSSFYAETQIHRLPLEDGKTTNYHCRKIQGEDCPVCDLYFSLWAEHKKLGLPKGKRSPYGNMATSIRATPRYYMNVIDRRLLEADPSNPEASVKIFSTGQQVFKKILSDVLDPDFASADDNPENGYGILSLTTGNDFTIDLTKKGDFNNYDESKSRVKKSPAAKPAQIAAIMESLHDIHTLVKIGDYEAGRTFAENTLAKLSMEMSPSVSDLTDNLPDGEIDV